VTHQTEVFLGFRGFRVSSPCVCFAVARTKWREREKPVHKRRDTEDNGATSFNVLFVRLELKKFWCCLGRNILALCSDLLRTLVLDLLFLRSEEKKLRRTEGGWRKLLSIVWRQS
jgi:hypothetical protein